MKVCKNYLLYAAILAFMGGCTPSTNTPIKAPPAIVQAPLIEHPVTGDTRRAEQLYRSAQSAGEATRNSIMLDSAGLFYRNGNLLRSRNVFAEIDPQRLLDSEYFEYTILGAERLRHQGAWAELKIWLDDAELDYLTPRNSLNQRRQLIDIQTDLSIVTGQIEPTLKNSVALAAALPASQRQHLHNRIWDLLGRAPYNQLEKRGPSPSEQHLNGWRQLAAQLRSAAGDHGEQLRLFDAWRSRMPYHPAADTPPAALSSLYDPSKDVAKVALLLPLQNQYRAASQTLLNGFMAGFYEFSERSDKAPEVHVYDSAARPLQEVFDEALSAGAEMIIGPVRSAGVRSLVGLEQLPVPTISLNRIDTEDLVGPANLFQFGLSPLDEMDQIADRAWLLGKRRVLIIAPEAGWGRRASEHFEQTWVERGGAIVSSVRYPAKVRDFSTLLKAPLHIDASETRGVELKRFVNSRLTTRARRRQDIDLVVMLSYPSIARQIKPALEFLYAADLPVYASSHIFVGLARDSLDRDLSGIEFCAMPWMLDGQLATPLSPDPELHTALQRFYALGYDAFLVHRELANLRRAVGKQPLFAATGLLSLESGQIKRRTGWAKFDRGRVVAIDASE